MQRPTHTITTKLGNKIELKTYFTQSERAQVTTIVSGNSTVGDVENTTKLTDLTMAQDKAVELAMVSLNDETEGIMDVIKNQLPASEYDEVSTEVMKLIVVDLEAAK